MGLALLKLRKRPENLTEMISSLGFRPNPVHAKQWDSMIEVEEEEKDRQSNEVRKVIKKYATEIIEHEIRAEESYFMLRIMSTGDKALDNIKARLEEAYHNLAYHSM